MKLALIVLIGATTGSAAAQDYPTLGQLTGITATETLSYDCGMQGGTLHCNFTQVKFSKAKVPSPDETAELAQGMFQQGMAPAQCKSMSDYAQRLERGEAIEGLKDSQRENALEMVGPRVEFCRSSSLEAAMNIARQASEVAAHSCNVWTYPFALDFTWNAQTARWETVSAPNGACGVVTAAYFETDKSDSFVASHFWQYGQQTLVTQRTGNDPLFGACAEHPNEAIRYTWKSGSERIGCEYVKFSIF